MGLFGKWPASKTLGPINKIELKPNPGKVAGESQSAGLLPVTFTLAIGKQLVSTHTSGLQWRRCIVHLLEAGSRPICELFANVVDWRWSQRLSGGDYLVFHFWKSRCCWDFARSGAGSIRRIVCPIFGVAIIRWNWFQRWFRRLPKSWLSLCASRTALWSPWPMVSCRLMQSSTWRIWTVSVTVSPPFGWDAGCMVSRAVSMGVQRQARPGGRAKFLWLTLFRLCN